MESTIKVLHLSFLQFYLQTETLRKNRLPGQLPCIRNVKAETEKGREILVLTFFFSINACLHNHTWKDLPDGGK